MDKKVLGKWDRNRQTIEFAGVSRTKQSMKDECDINLIMKKFIKTGAITHFAKHAGAYLDVPAQDYRECLEILENAQNMFQELPAVIRRQFGDDPANFLDFVQDEKNIPAMREMGLMNPVASPATATSPPSTGTATPPPATA